MDDSLILIPSKISKSQNCIHSLQIPVWHDFHRGTEKGEMLSAHILTCKECQKESKKYQEKMLKVVNQIPKARLTQSMRSEIITEIREMLDTLTVKPEEIESDQVIVSTSFALKAVRDLGSVFVSRSMVKFYLIASLVIWASISLAKFNH